MKTNWQQLSIDIHNFIRAGKTAEAAHALQKINSSQIPRENALEFARLSRRAGLFAQALRILKPVILSDLSSASEAATPAEIGEYSISLFKTGCVYEAMRWLDTIKSSEVGEAEMYLGFSHMMEWDYEKAVPPLKKFIAATPDSFIKLVAKVNLSAALVNTGETGEAETLIHLNIDEAEKFNNLRLKANSYELLSQIAIKDKNYKLAAQFLDSAWKILSLDSSIDQLFVVKWRAILNALQNNDVSDLNAARKAALEQSHFETLRDLDFYELKVKFSESIYGRLYCGTPFVAYRSKLLREFSAHNPPQSYIFGEPGKPVLDIDSMAFESGESVLEITPQLQQTFKAVWSDLYRPRSVGSLFEKIFTGEYFDINSSPNRVHRLVARLRAWLKIHDVAVSVEFENGGFVGHLEQGIQLQIRPQNSEGDSNRQPGFELKWNKAEALMNEIKEFSAEELADKLQQNHSSATRLLKWATENKRVYKKGSGRSSRYVLVK
jgi:tetratricopeptide (TPR) repeat protein